MLKFIGAIFNFIGGVAYIGGPVIAIILSLGVAVTYGGFWGLVLCLIAFPVVLIVAPFYMIFAYGDFSIFIFEYGGFIIGMILMAIGGFLEEKGR